ncbi:hypothetical protein EXIGLDRAFT_762417 [Exidia glandulosa HHB12029]|uniref:Uncharacterized protein n=1 Tax=Exidia glandulosa HHB12029 TaxID=1314781 RepID=A0A165MUA7_EXIGL|nr:hypothetical protein EXIGLDRAFT_762417 [Exidia glandulosa HHB12029]
MQDPGSDGVPTSSCLAAPWGDGCRRGLPPFQPQSLPDPPPLDPPIAKTDTFDADTEDDPTRKDDSTRLRHTTDVQFVAASTHGLFQVVAAVGTFGAGLSFSTFYTAETTENTKALAFLSWSYASFLICTVTTLIWQVVLISDLLTRGRACSYGRLFALIQSFVSATAGAILLCLALTQHRLFSVRVSGYTGIAAIGILGTIALAHSPPVPLLTIPTPFGCALPPRTRSGMEEATVTQWFQWHTKYAWASEVLTQNNPRAATLSVAEQAHRIVRLVHASSSNPSVP